MTVLGIAGCTALLVTGFGLRDSIHDIVDLQFGEIYKYNLSVYLDEGGCEQSDPVIKDFLSDTEFVSSYLMVHSESGFAQSGGKKEKVAITVPENTDALKQQYTLRSRRSKKDIQFGDDSVVLTEKLCETLGLSVGDKVALSGADGSQAEFTITGVCENYLTSFAYISRTSYEAAFGKEPVFKNALVTLKDDSQPTRDKLSARLLKSEHVLLTQFSQTIRESFENTVGRIDYIVVVLIISAGLLAVIVVYNLTNINICERKKELATIKVLGFHEKEVASYIYRETWILCIFGIVAGFGFGAWLHSFVVRTAEVDAVMFGRSVYAQSYLYAAVMTLLFCAVVDLVMLARLRRINMVESMKANE